jgi:hypothetical protein
MKIESDDNPALPSFTLSQPFCVFDIMFIMFSSQCHEVSKECDKKTLCNFTNIPKNRQVALHPVDLRSTFPHMESDHFHYGT